MSLHLQAVALWLGLVPQSYNPPEPEDYEEEEDERSDLESV